MNVTTVLLVYTLAGGVGGWTTGKLLKSDINPFVALGIAGLGGVSTLIPTIGRVVAFVVMVALFKQFSRGEWQDAFFAAVGASALALIVLLYLQTNAA